MMTKTIFEAYNDCKKKLQSAGIEDYGFESRQIIRHITGFDNNRILSHYNQPLTQYQLRRLKEITAQRIGRFPLQYILGEWDFYGYTFSVGTGVLIPRADTEILVEKALEFIKDKANADVLDLCAGSGCIGISIALQNEKSDVTLVEKYDLAIGYIKKNIKRNNVQNIKVISGDIFETAGADKKYDVIVSNPPYITASEMEKLQPEVNFEPDTALYGGEDGLMFYRAIALNYKDALKDGGILAFEVGHTQSQSVKAIMQECGYEDIEFAKDISGVDRVVFGTHKLV